MPAVTKILQFPWFRGHTMACNVYTRALGTPALNTSGVLTGTVGTNTRLYQFSMTDVVTTGSGYWVEMFDNGNYIGTFKVDLAEVAGYYDIVSGPTAGEIAAGVSPLVSINSYLSITPDQARALSTPNAIPCQIGCTFSKELVIGTITGWTELIFTVKTRLSDPDSASIIQMRLFASGGSNGLSIVNGSTDGVSAGDGSITVSDASTGTITVSFVSTVSALLKSHTCIWDVKVIKAASTSIPVQGNFVISPTITQSAA